MNVYSYGICAYVYIHIHIHIYIYVLNVKYCEIVFMQHYATQIKYEYLILSHVVRKCWIAIRVTAVSNGMRRAIPDHTALESDFATTFVCSHLGEMKMKPEYRKTQSFYLLYLGRS